jgi:hypothetical protein
VSQRTAGSLLPTLQRLDEVRQRRGGAHLQATLQCRTNGFAAQDTCSKAVSYGTVMIPEQITICWAHLLRIHWLSFLTHTARHLYTLQGSCHAGAAASCTAGSQDSGDKHSTMACGHLCAANIVQLLDVTDIDHQLLTWPVAVDSRAGVPCGTPPPTDLTSTFAPTALNIAKRALSRASLLSRSRLDYQITGWAPSAVRWSRRGARTCQQPQVTSPCVARNAGKLLQAARLPPAAGVPIDPRHLCTSIDGGQVSIEAGRAGQRLLCSVGSADKATCSRLLHALHDRNHSVSPHRLGLQEAGEVGLRGCGGFVLAAGRADAQVLKVRAASEGL